MKLLIIFLLFISTILPQENHIKSFAEKFISTLNQNPELLYDLQPTINDLHEVFPNAINSGISDSLLSFYFIRNRSLESKLEEIFLLQSLFENKKISANGDLRTERVDDETENIFFLEIPAAFDTVNAWFLLSAIDHNGKILLLEILHIKSNFYKKKFEHEFEEEEIEGELISPQDPIEPLMPVKNSSTESVKKKKENANQGVAAPIAEQSSQFTKEKDKPFVNSKILNESAPAHSNFIELCKKIKNKEK